MCARRQDSSGQDVWVIKFGERNIRRLKKSEIFFQIFFERIFKKNSLIGSANRRRKNFIKRHVRETWKMLDTLKFRGHLKQQINLKNCGIILAIQALHCCCGIHGKRLGHFLFYLKNFFFLEMSQHFLSGAFFTIKKETILNEHGLMLEEHVWYITHNKNFNLAVYTNTAYAITQQVQLLFRLTNKNVFLLLVHQFFIFFSLSSSGVFDYYSPHLALCRVNKKKLWNNVPGFRKVCPHEKRKKN